MVENNTERMEQHLLETTFPLEAKQIPLEALNNDERNVVVKCVNHEELSTEEFKLLKKTLQRYREAIHKYTPEESIKNFEKTQQAIQTEQDWLDIIDNEDARTLNVNVPFNEKWYPMSFEILPLDDSRVISTLQTHIDLFKDYSKEEIQLWSKAQQGQMITPEEKQIVDKMTRDMEDKQSEDRISSMNHFLASQLRLPNSTTDKEKRLEFWQKFPFITKAAIMEKVEGKLGLTEQKDEKLFPSG